MRGPGRVCRPATQSCHCAEVGIRKVHRDFAGDPVIVIGNVVRWQGAIAHRRWPSSLATTRNLEGIVADRGVPDSGHGGRISRVLHLPLNDKKDSNVDDQRDSANKSDHPNGGEHNRLTTGSCAQSRPHGN
jgi:hypothetical protein